MIDDDTFEASPAVRKLADKVLAVLVKHDAEVALIATLCVIAETLVHAADDAEKGTDDVLRWIACNRDTIVERHRALRRQRELN